MTIINLNQSVEFTPSFDAVCRLVSEGYRREAETGRAQLWVLFQVFGGDAMYLGMPDMPFIGNTLTLPSVFG